jgi:hypothetical protein
MRFSPSIAWFLVIFGVWSWVIWPTFMSNISADPRSWSPTGGPTAFFLVHLVIAVVSFILGTIIGTLGIRALIALRRAARASTTQSDS